MAMFRIQGDPQKQIDKLNKKQLKAFQRVSAGVLNKQAFATRLGHQETLKKDLTIRNTGLLKKATRVVTAKASLPLDRQRSKAGSIGINGHDGWKAIDTGKRATATLFTDEGRMGNSNKRMPRAGAKAGGNETSLADLGVTGTGNDVMKNYLRAIRGDKARRKKSFYIPRRYKKMRRGIYKFIGGKVGKRGLNKGLLVGARLIRLSTPKTGFNPKKISWNKRTFKRVITPDFMNRTWKDQMGRELRKIKGK